MKVAGGAAILLAAVFLLLAVPGREPPVATPPEHGRAFVWDSDSLWRSLEAEYLRTRSVDCAAAGPAMSRSLADLAAMTAHLSGGFVQPGDAVLDSLEGGFFALAPRVAACPGHLSAYVGLYEGMREAVKRQSRRWDADDRAARDRLYRALYGGRAAVEEVMLQQPDSIVTLLAGVDEPSATPSAEVAGVVVHSGDILVSRGGYPTSALIARGNDYPGNFSHVALVHVDSASHAASVIEAHIERGVAVATAEEYLRDKKLRLMVLRLRADLPQLAADPLLPHRAASRMLARARTGHIPYDFTMDYGDPSRLFCSEVASSAYRDVGIGLWMGKSTISTGGLRRWLASFGVRHFVTQEPSDLEYDPQLEVVAELRDAASLRQDHIDNAVTDAMLEGAEAGEDLTYRWYRLPAARLAKVYSVVWERFGRVGPVPEGMSAAAALRNQAYSDRHRRLADRVGERAAVLQAEQGYPPPYWTLLELAREAVR